MKPEQMRSEWRAAGGGIHGPNVETVTMPEAEYFKFRQSIEDQARAAVIKELLGEGVEPVEWTPTADKMPPPCKTVLVQYKNALGHVRRIRAKWVPAKTEESGSDSDFGEYDEATDTYYDPEGWYECIDNWDEYSAVLIYGIEITHWMPLPNVDDKLLTTTQAAAMVLRARKEVLEACKAVGVQQKQIIMNLERELAAIRGGQQ